ncbi:hypothetical protein F5X99DRAFT_364196 [Biscogniauxia marginata]|nr:hypothetical protein F5X99DRAFT_364196 [Biscogniauxia marginata]
MFISIMKSYIAATLALASGVLSASSSCPYNYLVELNSTESHNGLVFNVISSNPDTNNRPVQLRPNPLFEEGSYFVGVDNSSAVLLGNFRDGGFYSQARNQVNQLYDLGQTGYLNQRDETDGTVRLTVGFADAADWPGEVEKEWYLQGGSTDGTYSLFHQEPNGIVHGFLLCAADIDLDNGSWYQLFYYTYSQQPHDFPKCEFVGVRTTVAPIINNGACNIGGVTGTA